jgi:class 3 adenylate cyclase/tetratricopeptide (TPR) repeat protein
MPSFRAERGGETERRQITVMFVDMVGSTAMAANIDAEDYHDFLNEYHSICEEVVSELEGQVSQYLGDGVMVYFGYPEAHEDDPRRATEAALRILERTSSLNGRLKLDLPTPPRFRIGIHTGIAVIGRMGSSRERLALGETPNLAARLQQLAQPDTVVTSEATRSLIDGYFQLESLGYESVKGLDEPVKLYRVLRSTGAQTRVQAKGPSLTPLVGRDREVAELAGLWQAVVDSGAAKTAVVFGEAGIGKSRLVQTLKKCAADQALVLEGYCSPLHQNTVLRPIAQALETVARLGNAHEPQLKQILLESFLSEHGLSSDAIVLVASVLSLPVPEDAAIHLLTPAVKRQKTMLALADTVRALAKKRPVLFLIEDVHWADASTLDFLAAYTSAVGRDAVMLVITCRPECAADWAADAVTIRLQRLPQELAGLLVDRLTSGTQLPPGVRDRVVDLTDGVPFYLEEVTKSVLESVALQGADDTHGSWPRMSEMLVPATVQDSLTARLDRLGDSKPVAQLAAILGREFSHDVLRAIALMDEVALNASIKHLTESGLLICEDRSGVVSYRFKHALLQETAYQSLLKSRRKQFHHRVASVLRDQFPQLAETQPDVIAQHHARAELPALASSYFEKAGGAAFLSQAYVESINHYRAGLEQIGKLPAGKERDQRELTVLAGLGLPLLMTKGYAAAEVDGTYGRAMELCTETDPPVNILFGVWAAQLVRGDLANTERMVSQFTRIGSRSKSPAERLIAWAAIGSYQFWRGEVGEAIRSFEAAVSEFEPEMLATLPRDFGYDNALYPYLYLSWAQHWAGRFEEGAATWDKVWRITERARSPYLTVLALSFGAAMARDVGDSQRALSLSARGVALSSEHRLAFWLALARIQHGAALCDCGGLEEGTTLIERGLQFCRAIGIVTPLSYYLSYLAEAHLKAGALDKGLQVVDEGIALTETYLERGGLPALLRLRGELLLAQGGAEQQADECLARSVEVAKRYGGLWELRSTMSVARAARGRAGNAADLLRGAISRVGDGPPIVKSARVLLDRLR